MARHFFPSLYGCYHGARKRVEGNRQCDASHWSMAWVNRGQQNKQKKADFSPPCAVRCTPFLFTFTLALPVPARQRGGSAKRKKKIALLTPRSEVFFLIFTFMTCGSRNSSRKRGHVLIVLCSTVHINNALSTPVASESARLLAKLVWLQFRVYFLSVNNNSRDSVCLRSARGSVG